MPTTLRHQISYPSGSQAPNVPVVMQTMAESVDTAVDKLVYKDTRMVFKNAGFAWGANQTWDAGTLTADNSAAASSQVSTPLPTFATAGGFSGTLKFTEAGLYQVQWVIVPGAEPGNSGYRITLRGTWPGSPTGTELNIGQVNRAASSRYWESQVDAIVRVPTANLEISFNGIQTNATTNVAVVRVTQLAKL